MRSSTSASRTAAASGASSSRACTSPAARRSRSGWRRSGGTSRVRRRPSCASRPSRGSRPATRRALPTSPPASSSPIRSTRATRSSSSAASPPRATGSAHPGRRRAAPSCSGASSGSSRARRWPRRPGPSPPPRPPDPSGAAQPPARSSRPGTPRSSRARSTRACSACAARSPTRGRWATRSSRRPPCWRSARRSSTCRGDATRRRRPRCTRRSRSAERHGLDSAAAAAARELGYVEFLQARYERAEAWFARGLRLAVLDPAERGRIGSVLGSVRSDTAHYARAADTLAEACDLSEGAGDGRRLAYSLSMLGRVQLLTGELDAAAATLDASLARMRRESWAAFAPWPEALRGDVDVARGDLEAALPRYEHAFALGCQVGDACWEGMGARGIGIVGSAAAGSRRAWRCCSTPAARRPAARLLPVGRGLHARRAVRGRRRARPAGGLGLGG